MVQSASYLGQKVSEKGKEFVFRLKSGVEVARAANLEEFLSKLRSVSLDSIEYHTSNKHFGPWLRSLNMNNLAARFDIVSSKGEKLRQELVQLIEKLR